MVESVQPTPTSTRVVSSNAGQNDVRRLPGYEIWLLVTQRLRLFRNLWMSLFFSSPSCEHKY